jgi:hypothetical protein
MIVRLQTGDDRGQVILFSLCLAAVLGMALASSLMLVSNQDVLVARAQSWNQSLVIAEAGIEDGLALINKHAGTTKPINSWPNTAGADNWSAVGPNVFHVRRKVDGEDYYDVYVTNANSQPIIRSTGTRIWNLPFGGKKNVARSVVVTTTGSTLYQGGIVAKAGITITGNVLADSFNSLDPKYSTKGNYDPKKRKDGGNIATGSTNVAAGIRVGGNVSIYGKLLTGPEDTIKIKGKKTSIGSVEWVDGHNSGIEEGWSRNDFNAYIPDAPSPPAGGLTLPPKKTYTIGKTKYKDAYVLTAGNYQSFKELSLSGEEIIVVKGNVNLHLKEEFTVSGRSFIYIAENSSLNIYARGDVKLTGKGHVGTGSATNLTLYGMPTCKEIKLSGSSEFIGSLYAPQAEVSMVSGGDVDHNLIGSVVAKSIKLTGNYQIHYDEALNKLPATGAYYVASWEETAPETVDQLVRAGGAFTKLVVRR